MMDNGNAQRKLMFTGGVCFVLLLAVTAILLLYFSDALKPQPVLEVYPDNTYKETLHVVTDIDYEPFSYIDEDGNYAGLDVELIAELANRLHMNLELTLLDWPEANERFFSGEADAILNYEADLVADDSRIIGTIPTAEKQYVVYGRETVSSVAQLYGRCVASLHQMPELGLDDIIYVDSYAAIFEGLKNGIYEFAICPIQVGNIFLEKLDMTDVQPSYAVSHVYGSIALHDKDTALKEKLDEAISELTRAGRIEELDHKWITNRYQSMSLSGMVRSHPWIGIVFLGGLLFVAFLLFTLSVLNKNIREKEAYASELQLAKEQAEESSRAKSTFLSNMSHDLRTPMNAIIGYTNLADEDGRSLSETREYLRKIKNSSRHLLSLINDVLEMSRIESGKMELEEAPANWGKILSDVRDLFATQMQEKKITYTVDDSKVHDRVVYCDESRMNRVLLNLISNAYKFTPEGGTVSVTLSQNGNTREDYGEYELRVKDNGIGMTPEFAEKVFEAFERERTSTVSGIQGTGLGMAITKSIIDLMGGSIEVKSTPGEGTEFTILLSLRLCRDKVAVEQEMPSGKNTNYEIDFHTVRLLLVEDMDINREIASKLLTMSGFQLETAVNGKEAVDKMAENEPGYFDVILMDIQMPVLNGYDASRAIRALPDEKKATIPIIAMTANAFSEDVQKAHDAGMNGHIAKPIEPQSMLNTIKEVLLSQANSPRSKGRGQSHDDEG